MILAFSLWSMVERVWKTLVVVGGGESVCLVVSDIHVSCVCVKGISETEELPRPIYRMSPWQAASRGKAHSEHVKLVLRGMLRYRAL